MGKWLSRLPYVQQSRHGIFRYRRVVPPGLRDAAGKRDFVVSLRTRDPAEAEIRLLETHLAFEKWLRGLTSDPSSLLKPKTSSFIGWPSATLAADSVVLEDKKPFKIAASITLNGALALYLKEKNSEFNQYVGRQRTIRINEKIRVIKYLTSSLGEDRSVCSLTRTDARAFRDFLIARKMASGSVTKNIRIAAAIIEMAIVEHQIPIKNPFHRMAVVADVSAKEARLPMNREEIRLMLRGPVNEELGLIRNVLASSTPLKSPESPAASL